MYSRFKEVTHPRPWLSQGAEPRMDLPQGASDPVWVWAGLSRTGCCCPELAHLFQTQACHRSSHSSSIYLLPTELIRRHPPQQLPPAFGAAGAKPQSHPISYHHGISPPALPRSSRPKAQSWLLLTPTPFPPLAISAEPFVKRESI